MNEDTHRLLAELIAEVRGMKDELMTIRVDVGLLADEYQTSINVQSPLIVRDLFNEGEAVVPGLVC